MPELDKFRTRRTAQILLRVGVLWFVAVLGGFLTYLVAAAPTVSPATIVLLLLALSPAIGMWVWGRITTRE